MNTKWSRSALALVVSGIAIGSAIGGMAIASATQSPPLCNENDFILQMKQDPGPPFTVGQTINYSVRTGNTDPSLAGCDIEDVTVTLTKPNGLVVTLQLPPNTYPFGTPVTQVGALVPYVVNAGDFIPGGCGNVNICPIVRAKAAASGTLHDNPVADDTFTVTKELSGSVSPVVQTHYLCYEVKRQPLSPGNVSTKDQFGSFTPNLDNLHQLCNPVNKNGEDPSAPVNPQHLTGYEAKARGNPAQGTKVKMTDQFGSVTETIGAVKFVKVPAAKSVISQPAQLVNPTIDHYVCYNVKYSGFTSIQGVTLEDQFGPLAPVKLDKPSSICAPADVNGGQLGAETHALHYQCYDVDLPTNLNFKPPANIWIADEFQQRKIRLDAHVWELCVPAVKTIL